ncbi:MAG: tyrosine--tRNA ligase [Nitrospiraceae bacterium]|nr:tyrosine--tRNA ligase [Nitrospiraceae bacterium]
MNLSPRESLDRLSRGVVDLVSPEDLLKKLEQSKASGIPLRVKAGFDPTAPDLHLGHAVLLMKLREFQDLGHHVLFLIGDFTGMIGDPTGRSEIRKPLTDEEISANAATYREQVFRILDPERTEVLFNSQWMKKLGSDGLIRLAARQTVAHFLDRDDFRKRMEQSLPIHLHELLYPLIQGYDSVALKADVELGGTDQLFNLLVGRDLQRSYGQEPQVVLSLPLLVGLDGEKKMSKSLKNAVGILDDPFDMYGKIMSIPDSAMPTYALLLTALPEGEISAAHPRDAKARIALEITERFHGEEEARKAQERFVRQFSRREMPDEIPEVPVSGPFPVRLSTLMVQSGAARSESQAKQLILQKAVDLDGSTVTDPFAEAHPNGQILRVGKRFYCRLVRV